MKDLMNKFNMAKLKSVSTPMSLDIETYSQIINLHTSSIEITHSIIFINQILHKVVVVSTTKPSYQLSITQRIIVI
jgi:hypothetical protein